MTDKKISELTNLLETGLEDEDLVAVVDFSAPETKKISVGELAKRFHTVFMLPYTIDLNAKSDNESLHGGLNELLVAQVLSAGNPINIENGISRIMISVLAGSDINGTLTIIGDTIDRDTGEVTVADTESIVVNALTLDNSTIDPVGQHIHTFVGAYVTSKWFRNSCVISTTDLDLSDVDVFQLVFEQLNDHIDMKLITFDITFSVTNTAASFAGHLYTIISDLATNKVDVSLVSDLELLVANSEVGFYRLRQSGAAAGLDIDLDGRKDGVFMDLFFKPDNQQYFDGIAVKIWFHIFNHIEDTV